jgi:hypothetical protein
MSKNDNWTLGLIGSAWFGSDYEGKDGREEAKRIGFESLDFFVGFDPGRMSKTKSIHLMRWSAFSTRSGLSM